MLTMKIDGLLLIHFWFWNFWVQKEKAAEEEEADVDPDVAAMMGFGGFRSSKK